MNQNPHLRYFPNPLANIQFVRHIEFSKNDITQYIKRLVRNIEKHVHPIEQNAGDGIYVGTTGIAYMYYHLSKNPCMTELKRHYLKRATQYLQPALKLMQTLPEKEDELPSFYLGTSGVYAVAAAIHHDLGNQQQTRFYIDAYYTLADYCKEPNFLQCGSDELFVGRAGYIMGAIWIAKKTDTVLKAEIINDLCKVMVNSGRQYAIIHNTPSPLMYSYYKVEYLGAAHGLSTILQCLLTVPGYLEAHPEDREYIKPSIDYILSLQSDDGNFPASTADIGIEPKLVHWCHGAGGIFYLMVKSYLYFQEEKYLTSCKKIADVIWKKGLLKKGGSLCHGIAGNGYVFIIMYRLTADKTYMNKGIYFFEFIDTEVYQNNCNKPHHPYSLYEGSAGTVCYLSDLLVPDEASFPFSNIP